MRRPVVTICILFFIGAPAVAAEAESRETTGVILLEPAGDGGRWRAVYRFDQPQPELQFQRPASFYREKVWEIRTDGYSLRRAGDLQVLAADDAAGSEEIVVEFPVYTEMLPKEYELFQQFTDGSVSIYTGHFYAGPPGAPETVKMLRTMELAPPPGAQIVIQGKVHSRTTRWEDQEGSGTYIYVGGITPVENPFLTAIVDPGTPGWLRKELFRLLPELFEAYAEAFDAELPWKPMVLFSYGKGETGGLDSGGGTLDGLVQMHAEGSGWEESSPRAGENLLYLLAHEAAHLWNGQVFSYGDPADSWMHEGSADAFAEILLRRVGAIDEVRLADRRTMALNSCLSALDQGPLSGAGARGAFRAYYDCGNVIAVWTAAAVGPAGDSEALFRFWWRLFSLADEGRYDRKTYLAAMKEEGAARRRRGWLRKLLDEELDDPAEFLARGFAKVGLNLTRDERMPEGLRLDRARRALQHLMGETCGGRFSFRTEGEALRTLPMKDCPPFRRPLSVVAIEGHAIARDGDRAHEAVRIGCAAGEKVKLNLEEGGEVVLSCGTPLPGLPPVLQFPRPGMEALTD